MAGDLLACRSVSIAQLARHIFPRLSQERQYRLVTFLTLVLWVVALARTHLSTTSAAAPVHLSGDKVCVCSRPWSVQRVNRRIRVERRRGQLHVGRFPYAAPQLALHRKNLLRRAAVQRRQKTPQRALGR